MKEQKLNKKVLFRLKDKKIPCKFKWLDTVSYTRKKIDKISEEDITGFLDISTIYGIIGEFNDYSVMIITDICQDETEVDCTIIPIGNIISFNELTEISSIKKVKGGR